MNRLMTGSGPDPWRVPVTVAHVPDTGLHRELEASAAERQAMADLAGVREVLSAQADLEIVPKSGGRDLIEEGEDDKEPPEVADPPEAIVNGIIDLGRIATDALFLAIDPYPRKPGVVFEAEVTAPDPEDHPFAALKALQDNKQGKKKGK
jgi:hypothetical protein